MLKHRKLNRFEYIVIKEEPIGNHEKFADAYSKDVDNRPIHIFYERPATWSLLPKSLSGLNVLDLGCGSGWYAEQFIKAGAKVTAVDVSTHCMAANGIEIFHA